MSLHYPPRRNFGRRRWDRFVAAVGIGLGFVIAGSVLSLSQCDTASPTKPDAPGPVTSSQPAASNPTPAPTATPTAIGDDPAAGYELRCLPGSTLSLKYLGPASEAFAETWWTTFDNQNPNPRPGLTTHVMKVGGTIDRTFDVCVQGDARGIPGKELGGCFWDKNGAPFKAVPGAKQIDECRDCVNNPPKTEVIINEGYWGECQRGESQEGCYKTKKVTYRIDTTLCDGSVVKGETKYRYLYESCECPCVTTWEEQKPEITEGQFGACVINPIPTLPTLNDLEAATTTPQCAGTKTRSIRTIIREKNSCTGDLRIKSDTTKDDTASCQTNCPICHTSADKWCGEECTKRNPHWPFNCLESAYVCNNDWDYGDTKKYLCHNVPPGTSGHSNHNDDFWGWCGPVGGTTDKCYEIKN